MVDVQEAQAVYAVAALFRERCMVEGRSFLWPDRYIWTAENLRRVWDICKDKDTTGGIIEALTGEPEELRMIAVDVLAAGTFFLEIKRETQRKNVREFLDPFNLPEPDPATWNALDASFSSKIPGSWYFFSGYRHLKFQSWLLGLLTIVESGVVDAGRDAIIQAIEASPIEDVGLSNADTWQILHTVYPEQFAAVPSEPDRKLILRRYASELSEKDFPNDFAALDHLRKTLPQPSDGTVFDFYDPTLMQQWGGSKYQRRIRSLEGGGGTALLDAERESVSRDSAGSSDVPHALESLAASTHLDNQFLEDIHDLLLDKRQLIFEGPPGSGKTFVGEKFARWFTGQPLDETPLDKHVEIVQFHQSYGYEDFVQGIRPETNADGNLVYRVRDGIFLDMVERAKANPKDRFVLIIDEINRGNLSRIFGELLLLLEYRGQSVRLPYGSGDAAYLTIPENLYLIGTMNTADRSLAQIDYALRRRFYFVRFMPVENGRAEVFWNWLAEKVADAGDRERLHGLFVALNDGIQRHLNTADLQVGHSYFMQEGIETETVFRRVWDRAVRPLLEEYLHHHRNRDEILADLTPERLRPVAISNVPAEDADVDATDASQV